MGTHYSSHMDPERLREHATYLAHELDKLAFSNKKAPHFLVYRGMSGISLATAIAIISEAPNVGMIYVRKRGEDRHSFHKTEMEIPKAPGLDFNSDVYIFVDDFISTGDTLRECNIALRECMNKQSIGCTIAMLSKCHEADADDKTYFNLGILKTFCLQFNT